RLAGRGGHDRPMDDGRRLPVSVVRDGPVPGGRLDRTRRAEVPPLSLQGGQFLFQTGQFIPPVTAKARAAYAHHQVVRVHVAGGGDELPPRPQRLTLVGNGLVQGLDVAGALEQAVGDGGRNPPRV